MSAYRPADLLATIAQLVEFESDAEVIHFEIFPAGRDNWTVAARATVIDSRGTHQFIVQVTEVPRDGVSG